jgi:Flp pilus assembly secretin CpaC
MIIAFASAREDPMHNPASRRRAILIGVGAVAATSLPALAHHGWNWAEDQQSELKGTVKSVSMAPPHPSLKVTAADGKEWLIDLANPNQTERSGFTAASAKAGDAIVVLGNRAKDKAQLWMKAVRITVAGKTYDLYPERIKTN